MIRHQFANLFQGSAHVCTLGATFYYHSVLVGALLPSRDKFLECDLKTPLGRMVFLF